MSHINYIRRVHQLSHARLDEYLTDDPNSGNFSVFGGQTESRYTAAVRGLTRACGRRGVVILHNDSSFEDHLGLLQSLCPGSYDILCANRHGTKAYDPLYGLEETDVLDAIIPFETAGAAAPQLVEARSCLSDYLRIMRCQFEQGNTGMRRSPYNLDLLVSLTSMPVTELESRVLAYLPDYLGRELSGRMTRQGVQQTVWHMVSNYASRMSAYLWNRQEDWNLHSGLSIVSAIQDLNVISMRIPDSDQELLRCCTVELQSLIRRDIPFLIVMINLHIAGNRVLENLIYHSSSKWSYGLISPTINSSIGNEHIGDILRTSNQTVVLPCASVEEATVFSNAMGSYYRVIRPIDRSRQRKAFHIIPMLTRHRGYEEKEIRNIRPEELMNGNTLFCGADDDAPYLIRVLDL